MAGIVLEDNCHLLSRTPVSVLRQPLLRGGRSPWITRCESNWRTDRTHQGVLQARRWGGPKKTSAEFEDHGSSGEWSGQSKRLDELCCPPLGLLCFWAFSNVSFLSITDFLRNCRRKGMLSTDLQRSQRCAVHPTGNRYFINGLEPANRSFRF